MNKQNSNCRKKQKINQNLIPGPGQYQIATKLNTIPLSFNKSQRFQNLDQIFKKVPGPGKYSPFQPNLKIHQTFSKQQRFVIRKQTMPGPGSYQTYSNKKIIQKQPSYKFSTQKKLFYDIENVYKVMPSPFEYQLKLDWIKKNAITFKSARRQSCIEIKNQPSPSTYYIPSFVQKFKRKNKRNLQKLQAFYKRSNKKQKQEKQIDKNISQYKLSSFYSNKEEYKNEKSKIIKSLNNFIYKSVRKQEFLKFFENPFGGLESSSKNKIENIINHCKKFKNQKDKLPKIKNLQLIKKEKLQLKKKLFENYSFRMINHLKADQTQSKSFLKKSLYHS